jgi:hypothetical protein
MEWKEYPKNKPPDGMDWCLVTAERQGTKELWPVAFACYDSDLGWEFFETNDKGLECPVNSDYSSYMEKKEITHWMPIPESPKKER